MIAQDYFLEIDGTAEDLQKINAYRIQMKSADSLLLISQLDDLLFNLQQDGYLQSAVVSDWQDSTHLKAKVELGPRYQWFKLDAGNVDPGLLQKIGYRERLYSNRPFLYQEMQILMNQLVDLGVNSGYPFASVKLDCVMVQQNTVQAKLNYSPGPHITFDSLVLNPAVRTKAKFLQTYLKTPVGTSYSESIIEELPARIERLPYLNLVEKPYVTFQNDQASIHLALEEVKSNQFDGVIGFLPNAKGKGELLLTGQLNLLLQNMFGSGRRLKFQWESFKPESQQLEIEFFQPQLLKSPVNLDVWFKLFKEDSTFINRLFNANLEYAHRKNHIFGLSTQMKASRLPASGLLEESNSFPDLADFNLSQFGGTYRFSNADSDFNPKSGFNLSLQAQAGTKKIRRNSAVNDSLYHDLDPESSQFSWQASVEGYFPLFRHWVMAAKWNASAVYNEQLFYNDLYRLGGLKSIRGFSENALFAENFAYSSLETRFFFETDSYLFVFYDQAWWLSYNLNSNSYKDTPSGFGAGISLTTKAGIFNFVWAVGSSKQQEIGFNQSKIHFGYISRF